MNPCGVLFISTLTVLLCRETVFCAILSRSIQDNSLYKTLMSIPEMRHHNVEAGKRKADTRTLIKYHFAQAGLAVASGEVKIRQNSAEVKGENIVGTLAGSGGPDEKIVIVGAHYDTVEITPGVDDNASGLTALLETVKEIARRKCKTKHSIQFVAFDFEEDMGYPYGIAHGSSVFASGLKTSGNNAKVKGALILETILNHDSTGGSQSLPSGFEKLFPNVAADIQKYNNRGNFLAVVGRGTKDSELLNGIAKNFESDSDYRAQLVSIPDGIPDSFIGHLLRSDHASFWKNGMPALMLTDTADFRGYMKLCYHKPCDKMEFVKENNLVFLQRTIDAVVKTVLELSEASCSSKIHQHH